MHEWMIYKSKTLVTSIITILLVSFGEALSKFIYKTFFAFIETHLNCIWDEYHFSLTNQTKLV